MNNTLPNLTHISEGYNYLHHEQQCVKHNEGHDEILEGRRDDYSPHFVLKTCPFAWHIPLERSRFYREVYT